MQTVNFMYSLQGAFMPQTPVFDKSLRQKYNQFQFKKAKKRKD